MAEPSSEELWERAAEMARSRGELPPSREVVEAHAQEWSDALGWIEPYHDTLLGIVAAHNERFMQQVIARGEVREFALAEHVMVVCKLVIHRLLLLGAIERPGATPQRLPDEVALLEALLAPPPHMAPPIRCRRCQAPLAADELAFGSPETGWEHVPECPPS